jgi:hypothetical protein
MTASSTPAISTSRQRSVLLRTFRWGLLVASLASASLGWMWLLEHAFRPTATRDFVAQWPCGARPVPAEADTRIIVFAHPYCPCTRATLDQLDQSLTRFPHNTFVRVVFTTAGLHGRDIAESGLVAFARRMPRVDVYLDETAEETLRFQARVSGEVLAFDRSGNCQFHGGLTSGRGHRGESTGQRQLERVAVGDSTAPFIGPVYCCVLPSGTVRTDESSGSLFDAT